MEKVTIDSIMATLIEWTENKVPISPDRWIDAGLKMNVLKGPLMSRIIAIEQSLAKKRLMILESGKTAAYANIAAKADDEYSECESLKAKVDQIEEQIRLAKVRGKMGLSDYLSQ